MSKISFKSVNLANISILNCSDKQKMVITKINPDVRDKNHHQSILCVHCMFTKWNIYIQHTFMEWAISVIIINIIETMMLLIWFELLLSIAGNMCADWRHIEWQAIHFICGEKANKALVERFDLSLSDYLFGTEQFLWQLKRSLWQSWFKDCFPDRLSWIVSISPLIELI